MPPLTRRQAQRQRESENDDIDNAPATPPSTPPSTPTDDSNDENSEENYREYTPDNMSDEREPSPTRALVIERLLEAGAPDPEDQPLCTICRNDFPQPTADCPFPAKKLPCDHFFCDECITHWLMDPWFDTCPVCRKRVIKYEPGTGLPASGEGEDENDAQQENTAPAQNTALALTPGQARIAALQQEIFIRDEEIRLYNNAIRQAQQAPATRAPLRDITDAREFRERPNEENRRVPLGELTNGIPTFSRATTLQDPTTRDAQRAQAIRDADRARANRANRANRVERVSLFQVTNGGGPIRGRHPLQDVTNASPVRSLFDEDMTDVQPQQSRGRTPVQTIRVRPSTPPPGRSRRLINRSRSPIRDPTDPRSYRARRAPIQLPQLRLPPGQLRSLTPSDHGRGDGRRASNRSSTASSVYTLAPEFPPAAAAAANDVDSMLRSDARPSYFDAEAMIPDRFAGDPDSDNSDSDDSDGETAGRRTPRPGPAAGVRRLIWSRSGSPTPTPRASIPGASANNLNATWTPQQGQALTVRIDVARLRDQRLLLLNAIRFAGRGQAEEAFRAMLRVAESADNSSVTVAVEPLFRAMEQAGRDELVALARGQQSGVANRMNSPLRRRRIYGGGGGAGGAVVVLRPEILDAVRRLARRMVNLLRG